jgi:hypothetical protein
MPISPWYVGQTAPVWTLTWLDDSGNPENITGATITVRMRQGAPVSGAQGVAGTGTFNITNGSGGIFTYAVASTDFPNPGLWDLQFKAVLPGGGILYHDVIQQRVDAPV